MPGTKQFYDTIREPLFNGSLSQKQFDGIEDILEAWCDKGIQDKRYIAYGLATAYHETAKTMQPIAEYGKGKAYDYGKKLKRGGGAGKRIPYSTPDKLYYGRGYVQITWYENYQSLGKIIGVDLLNNPELALNADIAGKIMVYGMLNGYFTGKRLADYFNEKSNDAFNARKIINGLDAAKLIEGYYHVFYKALGC